MMVALGVTEDVEGDRGNYLRACLHDEFGFFNMLISPSVGVTEVMISVILLVVVEVIPSTGALW